MKKKNRLLSPLKLELKTASADEFLLVKGGFSSVYQSYGSMDILGKNGQSDSSNDKKCQVMGNNCDGMNCMHDCSKNK
jgi:hypothetical protein